tara:strand:- start:7821 stop:8738 length:918 start_codon:yes stop_codon:yes gene_type:complete
LIGGKMSRIKVFILNSNNADIESDSLLSWYDSQDPNGFVFEPSLEGIIRQSRDLDIPIDVEKSNYEELPSKTDSNLVILLNENSMISSKYLLNVVSLNNMYPDFSILCGNIENHYTGVRDDFFIKKISPYYRSYNVFPSDGVVLSDVSKDISNLPPSYNISVNGVVYNKLGGVCPLRTSRGNILDNRQFVSKASKLGDVIHSKNLGVKNIFSEKDLSMSSVSKYFYGLGYLASISIKSSDSPVYEHVWKQFVETPESLDHRILGRLTFEKEIPEGQHKLYGQKMAMIKCSYQCGLFEGLSGLEIL